MNQLDIYPFMSQLTENLKKNVFKAKAFLYLAMFLFLFFPIKVYAINPYYIHKSDSIGEIFREALFNPITLFAIGPIILAAAIIGRFFYRKHIAIAFYILFPVVFIINIILNKADKLSDILLSNINWFFLVVFLIAFSFFSSTIFNKYIKKKRILTKKDYIPLVIMLTITVILLLLPIRSGYIVCKNPVIKSQFDCSFWLESRQDKGWQDWFSF